LTLPRFRCPASKLFQGQARWHRRSIAVIDRASGGRTRSASRRGHCLYSGPC
jgi:hypothetical protein